MSAPLLVTRLRGPQFGHAAELLGVPGTCLVGSQDAAKAMTVAARARHAAHIVGSDYDHGSIPHDP